jgi:ribosomal protein S18 acetylase RimI-like enzyme
MCLTTNELSVWAGSTSQVEAAAGKATFDDRAVLTLRHFSECSYEEIAQILDLGVIESHRRCGFGGQLFREMWSQIARYFQLSHVKPRRVWVAVEQKSQVIARAFLTRHGFHHVATIENLLIKQDAMIYLKSFD